jgi:uncharacterized protein (DUF1778 family)
MIYFGAQKRLHRANPRTDPDSTLDRPGTCAFPPGRKFELGPGRQKRPVGSSRRLLAFAERFGRTEPREHEVSGRMPYTLRMASNATKTRRIEIRITEEERNLEQAAATANGETLSEFVRQAARREAERTLAERTRYVIDDEAAQRFLTALEQPSTNAEQKLRRLIDKPSVLPTT